MQRHVAVLSVGLMDGLRIPEADDPWMQRSDRLPFPVEAIQTDNGSEFQSGFHWHLLDRGIRHVYINARSPQLNGKVERSHRSDQEEFYQLLTYKDDVDLEEKLAHWERFYNLSRPHGAFNGKAPYEALREKL